MKSTISKTNPVMSSEWNMTILTISRMQEWFNIQDAPAEWKQALWLEVCITHWFTVTQEKLPRMDVFIRGYGFGILNISETSFVMEGLFYFWPLTLIQEKHQESQSPNIRSATIGCVCVHAQLYLTLCHSMYYSPPCSFVCGIFPERILECLP